MRYLTMRIINRPKRKNTRTLRKHKSGERVLGINQKGQTEVQRKTTMWANHGERWHYEGVEKRG